MYPAVGKSGSSWSKVGGKFARGSIISCRIRIEAEKVVEKRALAIGPLGLY